MTDEVTPQPTTEQKHTSHTYADDLAQAMDATDATVIQQIITEGKAREEMEARTLQDRKQRAWYKAGAIILIICTLGSATYSAYHYINLTVPAEKAPTVGVFPSTNPLLASETTIQKVIETLSADTALGEGKAYLVPLVSDQTSLTLLSNSELFSFFGSKPSEPFLTSFSLMRFGVYKKEGTLVPFVIGSTKDTDISTKELLIAEPELLGLLHLPLGIDMTAHKEEIGKEFSSDYMFNIPVRTLRYNTDSEKGKLLILYGRATDSIVVFTTAPSALKAIYDSLIQQH